MTSQTTPQLSLQPGRPEMQRAFAARDASYDGLFFVGVRSTGIFCRPSCPARRPRPENVEYYGSAREALFAGYRPCRRCRPLVHGAPEWVGQLLAACERAPEGRLRDADLRSLAIDPARARRYFRRHFGMTFQAYARGRRLGAAFERIRRGADLDEIVFDHGYESHSGFRDAFVRQFGAPPGRAAAVERIAVAWVETPLGPMIAGARDEGICLLEFTDRRLLETQIGVLRRRFPAAAFVPAAHPHLERLEGELARYFAGGLTAFTVPAFAPGTPFEERVWAALQAIPYGETRSYEELAQAIGAPGAQRAAGAANGRNRIALVIPCHRVVNKDGRVGGYGGGLWRKRWLLALEAEGRPPGEPSR